MAVKDEIVAMLNARKKQGAFPSVLQDQQALLLGSSKQHRAGLGWFVFSKSHSRSSSSW